MSQPCNIPLTPLLQHPLPPLQPHPLTSIQQNYFPPQTLSQPNPKLLHFHTQLHFLNISPPRQIPSPHPLPFITPLKSLHSPPNPKYFPSPPRLTYYNYTSDQFTPLHPLVIPPTI
ncbi:Tn3 family transposase, partial [Bacillus thuringiensis]|uniref:Tn3 family transposase n=1 Tax=Bacillus thuringiensis TaxID=1428 RepID=UPI003D6C7E65